MNKSNFTWIINGIKKRIPLLFLNIMINIFASLFYVAFSLKTKNVINAAIAKNIDLFSSSILILLFNILIIIFLNSAYRHLNSKILILLDQDWKRKLYKEIIYSDYNKISKFHSAELINRINNDIRVLDESLIIIFPVSIGIITKFIFAFAVLFKLEPKFASLFLCFSLICFFALIFSRTYLKNLNKDVWKKEDCVLKFFQEVFEKMLIIKSMKIEDKIEKKLDEKIDSRYKSQSKKINISFMANFSISFLAYLSYFCTLTWCSFNILNDLMSFGELTAIMQLVNQLQSPFSNISRISNAYVGISSASDRIRELESCDFSIPQKKFYQKYNNYNFKYLCARNIKFYYNEDEIILNDFSFDIKKGDFVSLVGSSGVGKSTLIKLLLGIYKPLSGEFYLINSNDEKINLDKSGLDLFSYVPQGNLLFSGTLKENLLLFNPDISEEKLNDVLSKCCLNDEINHFSNGINTFIGENSKGISEGQAQRISIARALLKESPIIILDEATSSLNEELEINILNNLKKIKDKTFIVITHRPAALKISDKIITISR